MLSGKKFHFGINIKTHKKYVSRFKQNEKTSKIRLYDKIFREILVDRTMGIKDQRKYVTCSLNWKIKKNSIVLIGGDFVFLWFSVCLSIISLESKKNKDDRRGFIRDIKYNVIRLSKLLF